MSYLVSKKAAAEFFGVSVQALDGWFTAGCPVAKRDHNDRIELLDLRVMTQWRIDRAGDGGELDRERTRLTKAQADKTELEVAELRAELVRAPVLENHWQNMVAAARAKLLSLPSKLAPQIAGPDQLTRVQDMLHAGVFEALAELAGDAFPDNIRVRVDKAASQPHDLGMEATTEADSDPVGKRPPATQRGGQRGAGPVPKRPGPVSKRGARRAE